MEKKRLFQILSRAQRSDVIRLGEMLQQQYPVTIVKKPEKSLTMIRMREPVKNSLFYLGEAIITEAVVSLGDTVGTAVTMGDDFEKTLHMAIIDAAENKGVFTQEDLLLEWEQAQQRKIAQENAMFQKTKVDFHSMDSEAAQRKHSISLTKFLTHRLCSACCWTQCPTRHGRSPWRRRRKSCSAITAHFWRWA